VLVPGDALLGFDIPDLNGGRVTADDVMRVTLSLLAEDFAQVMPAAGIVAAL
jgi:hypothetical protein